MGARTDRWEPRPGNRPNTINRENVRRRIIIQCNTAGRGLVDVVRDIQARVGPIEQSLPTGYFASFEGQFESQQSASRVIAVLFALSSVGVFLVLYSMFRSANLSLQVMIALPLAFVGAVAALLVRGKGHRPPARPAKIGHRLALRWHRVILHDRTRPQQRPHWAGVPTTSVFEKGS